MQSRVISGARILQEASRAVVRLRTPFANSRRALWWAAAAAKADSRGHLLTTNARVLGGRHFTTSPQCSEAKETMPEASSGSASGLAVGDEMHGFVVDSAQTVSELQLKAVRLRHAATGAEWLHIDRDDRNNVFSVGFSTSVSDSTGVPHILEHTTLCGSEKYPVRDPFFKMLNRSMSTFMNAWTAHDYTQYP
ncbi:Mitochondrial presequence protease, partial [Coemansia sp. RSA 2399]